MHLTHSDRDFIRRAADMLIRRRNGRRAIFETATASYIDLTPNAAPVVPPSLSTTGAALSFSTTTKEAAR